MGRVESRTQEGHLNKKYIWFGLICGGVVSITVNASLLLFLFFSETGISFLLPLLCIAFAAFLLKSDKWKSFWLSNLFSFIGFVLGEVLFANIGVLMYFYRMKYGDVTDTSLGFGFVALILYFLHFLCLVIGTIIAAVFTAVKIKRSNTCR